MPADRLPVPSVGRTRHGKASASPVVRSQAQQDPEPRSRASSRGSPVSSTSSSRKRKKRPPNAFIIFRSNLIKARAYPAHLTHQSDISSYAAKFWNFLPDEDRNVFYRQAEVVKKRFEAEQSSEMVDESVEETTRSLSSDLRKVTESPPHRVQDDAINSGEPRSLTLENARPSEPFIANTRSALPTVPALNTSALPGTPATPQSMGAQEISLLHFQSGRIPCANDRTFAVPEYTSQATHTSASSPDCSPGNFDVGTASSSNATIPSDPALSTTHGIIFAPTSANWVLGSPSATRFPAPNASTPSDAALYAAQGMDPTTTAANWPRELFDASSLSGLDNTARFDSGPSSRMELHWGTGFSLDIPPPPSFSFEDFYDQNFSASNM